MAGLHPGLRLSRDISRDRRRSCRKNRVSCWSQAGRSRAPMAPNVKRFAFVCSYMFCAGRCIHDPVRQTSFHASSQGVFGASLLRHLPVDVLRRNLDVARFAMYAAAQLSDLEIWSRRLQYFTYFWWLIWNRTPRAFDSSSTYS